MERVAGPPGVVAVARNVCQPRGGDQELDHACCVPLTAGTGPCLLQLAGFNWLCQLHLIIVLMYPQIQHKKQLIYKG